MSKTQNMNTPTWDSLIREHAYLKGCTKRLMEIISLPNCNTCDKRTYCEHRPGLEENARYNCFDYKGCDKNEIP